VNLDTPAGPILYLNGVTVTFDGFRALDSLSLLVELAAFVRLRVAAPDLPRPWRVPGGLAVAVGVAVFPALFCVGAMATAGLANTIAGAAAALTGPLAYRVLGRRTMLAAERA